MKKILVVTLLLSNLLYSPALVAAESINLSISGNGDGSSSSISTSVEQQQTVEQTNNSTIENQVQTDSNTGGNSVSANTGSDVAVETGSTNTQVQVDNSQVNTNVIETTGCSTCGGTSVAINGNGSDSTNQVVLSGLQTSTISQQNSATITTSVHIDANTGRNTVSNNTASEVLVKTGDIRSGTLVENSQVNQNTAQIALGNPFGKISGKISGNGSDSNNSLVVTINKHNNITVSNRADIHNYLTYSFNTGENNVSDNTAGKVWVQTGDILAAVSVSNTGINSNHVEYTLDCDLSHPNDPEDPTDPSDPSDPGNPGSNSGSSNTQDAHIGGVVASSGNGGQVLGAILPVTGANLAAILLANGVSILSGLAIRFRKVWGQIGRSRICFTLVVRWD